MSALRRNLVVVGVVVLLLAGGGAFYLTRDQEPRLATSEVSRYLDAWERFDPAAMATVVDAPAGLAEAVTAMHDDLRVTQATFRALTVDEEQATFSAELEVGGIGRLQYDGVLPLVRQEKDWRIGWAPRPSTPRWRPDSGSSSAWCGRPGPPSWAPPAPPWCRRRTSSWSVSSRTASRTWPRSRPSSPSRSAPTPWPWSTPSTPLACSPTTSWPSTRCPATASRPCGRPWSRCRASSSSRVRAGLRRPTTSPSTSSAASGRSPPSG